MRRRNALCQFIQCRIHNTIPTFLCIFRLPSIKRQVPGNSSQKQLQTIRFFRWNRIPSPHPGIIQTFFGIFSVMQDMISNTIAVFSVALLCLCDGLFVPRPIQFQYCGILHWLSPFQKGHCHSFFCNSAPLHFSICSVPSYPSWNFFAFAFSEPAISFSCVVACRQSSTISAS